MTLSNKFNFRNLGEESERNEKKEKCFGYSTKYKIVCERCGNPHNKYCPFYIPSQTKSSSQ